MSFLARPVYEQFQKFKKMSWGHCPPATPKIFLHGVWELDHDYLLVRFDLPASINYGDIKFPTFPNLGAQNPY